MNRDPMSHTFILRFWCETDCNDTPFEEWRAIIEDVESKQRLPVTDYEALRKLLRGFGLPGKADT